MRIVLGLCVVLCLTITALGVHLVLQQQRQVEAFSAPTTAVILERRVEQHERPRGGRSGSRYAYEPVVTYRYQADGRQYTSSAIFPFPSRAGGNVARAWADGIVKRFPIGEETAAWYDPNNPADACLIRRPQVMVYLVILAPMIVVGGVLAYFWRPHRELTAVLSQRRKFLGVAVMWHGVGLAAAGHYFYVSGPDYAGAALVVFGLYTQFGLIPVALALPPSEISRRLKAGIWGSLFGVFAGFWLGAITGWLAGLISSLTGDGPFVARFDWIGYGMAITAGLFALLGLTGRPPEEVRGRQPQPE